MSAHNAKLHRRKEDMPRGRETLSESAPTPRALDSWLSGIDADLRRLAPTVEELQSSLSWRITEPLRALRLRERLQGVSPRGKRPALAKRPEAVERARDALRGRLDECARLIAPHLPDQERRSASPEALLGVIVAAATAPTLEVDKLWLVTVAVSGCYPDQAQFLGLLRDTQGLSGRAMTERLLRHCGVWMSHRQSHFRDLRIVSDRPVVLAHTALSEQTSDEHGLFLRAWLRNVHGDDKAVLTTFTEDGSAIRLADMSEKVSKAATAAHVKVTTDSQPMTVVAPWRTTALVAELMPLEVSAVLTSMARFSGNRVCVLGMDTSPATAGLLVGDEERLRFSGMVTLLKYSAEVFCPSESGATAFAGIVSAFSTQGLTVPRVRHIQPRIAGLRSTNHERSNPGELPTVLVIDDDDPRSNLRAAFFAAERAWRNGAQFRLVVFCARREDHDSGALEDASALQLAGRPVEIHTKFDGEELEESLARARALLTVPLAGPGLGVWRAQRAAVPAIASETGATGEFARRGGCVTVDPDDDEAIAQAIRTVVVDTAVWSRLYEELKHVNAQEGEQTDPLWGALAGWEDA